jgi:hypothetical protein
VTTVRNRRTRPLDPRTAVRAGMFSFETFETFESFESFEPFESFESFEAAGTPARSRKTVRRPLVRRAGHMRVTWSRRARGAFRSFGQAGG